MRIYRKLSILLFSILIFSSCSEIMDFFRKDAISASPSSATLTAAAQEYVFDIKASEGWTAKSSGKWISLDPYSGDRSTEQIFAKISANTELESRTDTVTLICGKATLSIPVTQDGMSSIISATSIVLDETASFTMEAYSAWRISLTDTKAAPSWLEATPVSGQAGHTVISVKSLQDNVWDSDRNAFIKISFGDTPFYVTVTQKHVDAILESADKVEAPSEGGQFSFNVKSNMKYSIKYPDGVDWVHPVISSNASTKAATTKTEYFSIDRNEEYDSRETFVVVNGDVASDTVKIFQAQKDALILNADSLKVSFYQSSHLVELRTNIEYSTSIDQTGDWIRIVSPQALRTDQINLRIDENTSESAREARIIFKDVNSTLSDTLYVIQNSSLAFPFTNETDYGIYGEFGDGECAVFTKYLDQVAVSNGNLRIQRHSAKKYILFSGLPENIVKGDTFTLDVKQNYNPSINPGFSVTVKVIKEDSTLLWLINEEEGYGFIINK